MGKACCKPEKFIKNICNTSQLLDENQVIDNSIIPHMQLAP